MSDLSAGRFGSGKEVRRVEDASLLTGQGRFADDFAPQSQAHLVILRSPYPHARIVSIDTGEAERQPGVLAVITGADLHAAGVKPLPGTAGFKRPDGSPARSPSRRALAHETVGFVGDGVVAVVARTRAQARDALDLIQVEYEELPSVIDPQTAIEPGAIKVSAELPDNIVAQARHGDAAAADRAFAQAAHVVTLELVNQRLIPAPIEPRSVQASHDAASGRTTIRISNQMPTAVRGGIAGCLGIAPENLRVLVGDVGGGFGMKTGPYPEDVVTTWAARQLGLSVQFTAERSDDFLAGLHGRDIVSTASLALDPDGRVLALRIRTLANVGAYATGTGVAIQLLIGPWVTTSIYDIELIDLQLSAVATHTAPTGAYRGAGRPEAIYIIERLMDAAARQLGIPQPEIRRRNLIPRDRFPYRNAMNQLYDSGAFESIMDQGLALARWNDFADREAASARRGRLRGRGLATFLEWTGGNAFEEAVAVRVSGDGYVEMFSATQAMGQGIVTSYAQLAVDVLGIPIDRIRILQGDTDRGNGFGSAGSRSLFTGGSAVRVAAERTVEKARELAADELEVNVADVEYLAGELRIVGTDRGVGLFDLAARQPGRSIVLEIRNAVSGPSWPNGCHVCEVEIDPQTGQVEVASYASMNDAGRIVNPMIVRGQLDGGAMQGIGQALCERFVYDEESGQALSASFLDYAMPHADTFVGFVTELDQSIPCLNNPLGVKGVGELGTIGATPAVVNAVIDAVSRARSPAIAYRLQMPLTPERVWRALNSPAPGS